METTELSWLWPYVKNVQHVERWKEKIKTNAEVISPDSEEWHIITSKVVMDLQQQTKKPSDINEKIMDQRQIELLFLFLYSLTIPF